MEDTLNKLVFFSIFSTPATATLTVFFCKAPSTDVVVVGDLSMVLALRSK